MNDINMITRTFYVAKDDSEWNTIEEAALRNIKLNRSDVAGNIAQAMFESDMANPAVSDLRLTDCLSIAEWIVYEADWIRRKLDEVEG